MPGEVHPGTEGQPPNGAGETTGTADQVEPLGPAGDEADLDISVVIDERGNRVAERDTGACGQRLGEHGRTIFARDLDVVVGVPGLGHRARREDTAVGVDEHCLLRDSQPSAADLRQ
jgi:hypothetical protein